MKSAPFLLLLAFIFVSPPAVDAGRIKVETTRLTLTLSHPTPSTGARMHYRVVFKNVSDTTIQVPMYLIDHLRLRGEYTPPGAVQPVAMAATIPPGTPLASVKWKRLRPGAAIEVFGDLADVFKECAKGCQSGTYRLRAVLAHPMVKVLGPGRTVPDRTVRTVQVEVKPHRLARSGMGIDFRISRPQLSRGGKVQFQGRFRNRSKSPIWIPKPKKMLVECAYRISGRNGTVLSRYPVQATGFTPFDEAEAVLIQPGGEHVFTMTCGGGKPTWRPRTQVLVRALVRPAAEFYPLSAVPTPYYLAAKLASRRVRLR